MAKYLYNCAIRPVPGQPDKVEVVGPCVVTGKPYKVVVDRNALERWNRGECYAQDIPDLTVGQREFLISGIAPEGWNDTFKEA